MTRPESPRYGPARPPRAHAHALVGAAFLLLLIATGATPPSPRAQTPDIERLTRHTFADLAEAVRPAVVTVEVWEFLALPQSLGDITNAPTSPRPPGRQPPARTAPEPMAGGYYRTQGGSGVLLAADGVVVTSLHLVAGLRKAQDRLRVVLANGRAFEGDEVRVVGTDPFTDLAVLRLEGAAGFPALAWGDSEAARLGEWVMVVGNPLDFEFSLSEGILSGKHRSVDSDTLVIKDLLQTTAVINAGNSGGALVDLDGRLLGIVTAIATTGSGWQGLGFAMPQHIAQPVVESLLERGYVQRGYLGVSMEDIVARGPRARLGPAFDGIRLAEVVAGFPAEAAGLRPGDLLRAVEGRPIGRTEDVLRVIATRRPGERVTLTVERGGRRWNTVVELAERPGDERLVEALAETVRRRGDAEEEGGVADAAAGSPGGLDGDGDGGMGAEARDGEAAAAGADRDARIGVLERAGLVAAPRLREERGLLVLRVEDGAPAALAGLRDGDLLLEVDGAPIVGITSLRERLADAERRGLSNLRVDRQGRLLDLTLRFPRAAVPPAPSPR